MFVECVLYKFIIVPCVLISGPLCVPCALYNGYFCLFTDEDNFKILLDGDEVLQLAGDSEKLAVIGDVADVSQDDFLLIHFPHFKVLKQNIYF